ncbi:MAG: hypothetical protein CVV03_03050 [Firmicutes bacterium HGW-Firmicutes-8]|nr:MAG: hypothetical protein CVV03_03050 [Firmicutes bacterium HGW-Firmicutes-8]
MSKVTSQAIIDERGRNILRPALDPCYFFLIDFSDKSGKDSNPDIDGLIRLRNISTYFNQYLHFQLKSTNCLKNNKFYCSRKIIDYLCTTNVPTILFVVEVDSKRVFWLYLDEKLKSSLELHKDKKGRTFNLSHFQEIVDNFAETNQQWQTFAKKSDYIETKNSLDKIVTDYRKNIEECVGLLYLFGKVLKNQLPALFKQVLKMDLKDVEVIINRLRDEGVIFVTANYYLLENEQLGVESLFKLLNKLNLNSLDSVFDNKIERKTILRQLSKIEHAAVQDYFKTLVKEILELVNNPTDNDDILVNLELLEEFVYQVPKETLKIVRIIIGSETPLKTLGRNMPGFGDYKGKSHEDLILKCIKLLNKLRYIDLKSVFQLFLRLSLHSNSKIRSEATKGIENIAEYNIFVLQKIGYGPQINLLNEIEKWSNGKQFKYLTPLLEVCSQLINPSFEGHSMTDYNTVTIHSGPLSVNDHLKNIRIRAISLLKKLYLLSDELNPKRSIIKILRKASQTPYQGNYGEDMEKMVLDNTNSLIDFYITITPKADNEIIKEIEEEIHWFIRRFTRDKLSRICELESTIASITEYELFRTFVGYDTRFCEDLDWRKAQSIRKKKIQDLIQDISKDNFDEYQTKILSIIKNYPSANPGEFQYFNIFLNEFGRQKPELAIRLLTEKQDQFDPFIIHLISGIWKSKSPKLARNLIYQWVNQGKHLSTCSYIFTYVGEIDKLLLNAIFSKAIEVNDNGVLNNIVDAIASNYPKSKNIKPLFMKTIKKLTENGNSDWINNVWFQKGFVTNYFTRNDFDIILQNLLLIPDIDYHTEEILFPIAEKYPKKVINYFYNRVYFQQNNKHKENCYFPDRYDAIPYNLHKIDEPLRKQAKKVVPEIFVWFNEDDWLIFWEASHLVEAIYPNFDDVLERELIKLIKSKNNKKVRITLSILKAYEGQTFLHNVCKQFIKQFPDNGEYHKEMLLVLSQTGTVSGEYGFVEAYEQKKKEIQSWKKDNDKAIKTFAEKYEDYLNMQIEFEQKRADETIELMKRGFM